jgi:hypothetical protein
MDSGPDGSHSNSVEFLDDPLSLSIVDGLRHMKEE